MGKCVPSSRCSQWWCHGGALTSIGAAAVIHPIAKQLNDERMTGKEYVKDVGFGSTIGAITGPIGAMRATGPNFIATKAV